jgi:exopolysaccharide biosynthesis protein
MSTQKRSLKRRRRKKKKFRLILFFIYEFIIATITLPLLVFYGPFTGVRDMVVNTAMQTFTHQYIATTFLSKEKINEILNNSKQGEIEGTQTENSEGVSIEHRNDKGIEQYEIPGSRFDGYILEVKDPTRIKIGYTKHLGKVGEKTSEIAEDHNAIAAINGGGFQDKASNGKLWTGTGGYPEGIVISNGKSINSDVNPESKLSVAAFDSNGKLIVGYHSLNELLAEGVKEALSFDTPLIINGKTVAVSSGLNPRTAIGQKSDGTVVLLVIDGRNGVKLGASLKEVQTILLQRGVVNAANLDGGSSSTMYYNGEVINDPCDWNGERTVATAVYVER